MPNSTEDKFLSKEEAEKLLSFLNSKQGNKKEFAQWAGKTQQTISNWCRDEQFPIHTKKYLDLLEKKKEIRSFFQNILNLLDEIKRQIEEFLKKL